MTVDADRRSPPCVLVIFGASGDLTARKLLPALARLAGYGALPPEVALVGVARTPMTDDEFGDLCRRSVSGDGDERWRALTAAARYVHGGYDDPATYQRLAEVMAECDHRHGTAGNRVYYFATPPRLFGPIAVSLGKAALSVPEGDGFVRAVIEKPFGWDEVSAKDLYADLSSAFVEEQIFRIDHYLAKETVQNLLALRFANSIFEPIWNRTWVDNVQITVAETLGVGDRGRLLRDHRRDARHRPEPRPAGALALPHGTADLVPRRGDPRREGETAPGDPPAGRGSGDRGARGARPVHPRRHPRGPHARVPGRARASTR